MAQFRTKARAIELLGKNQIADLPTAITELWKNGYDAYGDRLRSELFKAGYKDVTSDIFIISDDGHGMTKDDVIDKWIVLGTNSKLMGDEVSEHDRFGKEKRVTLGEKGIGRLSVTYLGSQMLLLTKKQSHRMVALFMDWDILSNSDLYIDDINIPVAEIKDETYIEKIYAKLVEEFRKNLMINTDDKKKKWGRYAELREDLDKKNNVSKRIPSVVMDHVRYIFNENNGHGTMFLIFDPIDQIREIGTKKDEDDEGAKENQDFLVSALSGLFNPLDRKVNDRRKKECGEEYREYPSFNFYEPEWGKRNFLAQQGEFFTFDEFKDCENWIDGKFDRNGDFSGYIKVFGGEPRKCNYSPRKHISLSQCGELILRLAFWEGDPRNTTLPIEVWSRYEKKGELFSGLYIYRDGFRVLPYGRTDYDFLRFEKRRSTNAGRYYFSHRKMFGYIAISKEKNPKLIDKAGREGFVSNTAYTQLKSVLCDFFIAMADQYFGRKAEDRAILVSRANERSRQARLLKEEQKRRKKERREFLRIVYRNEPKLNKAADNIKALKLEAESYVTEGYIKSEAIDRLYQKLHEQETLMKGLQIVKPADMSLEEEEDAFNDYEIYRMRYQKIEEQLIELKQWFTQRTYINELIDQYKEEVFQTLEGVNQTKKDDLERYQKKSGELKKEMELQFQKAEDALTVFLPKNVGIENFLEKDIREKIDQLIEIRENELNPLFLELQIFLKHYEKISVGKGDSELIGAYQSTNARLRKENAQIFEMAQVGMAIEQQDHQFNAMYGKIRETLLELGAEKFSEKVLEKFSILKMAIQHLESNYKQLQPLYHVSKKQKISITGKDIELLVDDFYQKSILENNVLIRYSDDFLNSSIYTYSSIIMPVVLNIVNNALYWLGKSEERIIEMFSTKSGEWVICNSGPKMQPYELERCFDLFFSKKASGRGIGLYLAKETLRSVGMDIYTSQDEQLNKLNGACFVITKRLLEDV